MIIINDVCDKLRIEFEVSVLKDQQPKISNEEVLARIRLQLTETKSNSEHYEKEIVKSANELRAKMISLKDAALSISSMKSYEQQFALGNPYYNRFDSVCIGEYNDNFQIIFRDPLELNEVEVSIWLDNEDHATYLKRGFRFDISWSSLLDMIEEIESVIG